MLHLMWFKESRLQIKKESFDNELEVKIAFNEPKLSVTISSDFQATTHFWLIY